jgi:pyrroline-5-carboxylate reductase
MTYGVIGVGAIASAIVTGLCKDVDDAPRVLLSPRNAEISAGLAERFATVDVAADNQAVVDGAEVVIVCVRPEDAAAVLGELRFPADRIVLSAVAGVSIETLQPLVAPATDIAQVIPLPWVARRDGNTLIHPPHPVARELFDPLGGTIEFDDVEAFEAFSATTATIAAHLRYVGAIAEWLASKGASTPDANRYVAAIFAGLAEATRGAASFDELVREAATPGGYNEQFLRELEERGTYDQVKVSLDRMLERSRGSGT